MNIKPGTNLSCGCCGIGFTTWPNYVDQDQDRGFGICFDCQDFCEELSNQQLDVARGKLREALNDKNRTKWDSYDTNTQRHLALRAIEDGIISFAVGGVQ